MQRNETNISRHDVFLSEEYEDDEYQYDDDEPACHRCDGSGIFLICPDDMCQGAGECMHGDGEIACPSCFGDF